VDRNDKKKAPRRMTVNARGVERQSGAHATKTSPEGMTPALQAHIGRQVRAAFDEVAQEPIPDHLLRLLQDLDRSGDK
jgi:Anti-sigma factor NepR